MSETHYNIRWWSIVGLLALGISTSQLIAHYVPSGSSWQSYLFIAYAAYGMFYAIKGLWFGIEAFVRAEEPDTRLTVKVFGIATLRRELIRGVAHLNVLLLGLLSVSPPSWFGEFFVAAMFMLVYTMNVNATLDDTLIDRMRKAQAEETRLAVEKAKMERADARRVKAAKTKKTKGK